MLTLTVEPLELELQAESTSKNKLQRRI